jgi:hypothetical protein
VTQGPFGRAISRKACKLALLEPLTPDTVTVALKCQQFYLSAAPVDKDKPMTAGRILAKMIADHRRQTIE